MAANRTANDCARIADSRRGPPDPYFFFVAIATASSIATTHQFATVRRSRFANALIWAASSLLTRIVIRAPGRSDSFTHRSSCPWAAERDKSHQGQSMAAVVAHGQPTADNCHPSRTTMEENDMIRNAWVKRGATCNVLAIVAALGGCADDPAVDPTGNWNLTLSWGAGTCGFTGLVPVTLTVTQGPNGYVLAGSTSVVGVIQCTADKCTLSSSETGSGTYSDGTPYTSSGSLNLSLDANGKVTGSGQYGETAQDGFSCSQTFTATGTKS